MRKLIIHKYGPITDSEVVVTGRELGLEARLIHFFESIPRVADTLGAIDSFLSAGGFGSLRESIERIAEVELKPDYRLSFHYREDIDVTVASYQGVFKASFSDELERKLGAAYAMWRAFKETLPVEVGLAGRTMIIISAHIVDVFGNRVPRAKGTKKTKE